MVQKNGQKNISKVVQQSMFYPVRLKTVHKPVKPLE